jgi:hypothetical protein
MGMIADATRLEIENQAKAIAVLSLDARSVE